MICTVGALSLGSQFRRAGLSSVYILSEKRDGLAYGVRFACNDESEPMKIELPCYEGVETADVATGACRIPVQDHIHLDI